MRAYDFSKESVGNSLNLMRYSLDALWDGDLPLPEKFSLWAIIHEGIQEISLSPEFKEDLLVRIALKTLSGGLREFGSSYFANREFSAEN